MGVGQCECDVMPVVGDQKDFRGSFTMCASMLMCMMCIGAGLTEAQKCLLYK